MYFCRIKDVATEIILYNNCMKDARRKFILWRQWLLNLRSKFAGTMASSSAATMASSAAEAISADSAISMAANLV